MRMVQKPAALCKSKLILRQVRLKVDLQRALPIAETWPPDDDTGGVQQEQESGAYAVPKPAVL